MLFDQNIKTPSHEKIRLSEGKAFVSDDGANVRVTAQWLDENDAIRLAAFLNRWYNERNRAELRAAVEASKASREAKKQRSADRRVGLAPATDYTIRVNGGERRTLRTEEMPK